jgi:hypothetical protein
VVGWILITYSLQKCQLPKALVEASYKARSINQQELTPMTEEMKVMYSQWKAKVVAAAQEVPQRTYEDIAKEFGCSFGRIAQIVREAGFARPRGTKRGWKEGK